MAKKPEPVEEKAIRFEDKAFKSRTIVLKDGSTFFVQKGVIETSNPELIEYLRTNPEFEQVQQE